MSCASPITDNEDIYWSDEDEHEKSSNSIISQDARFEDPVILDALSSFDDILEPQTSKDVTTEPLIVIPLEKLCGYQITDEEECKVICSQLEQVMNEQEFFSKSCELFDANVAVHTNSATVTKFIPRDKLYQYCIMKYPQGVTLRSGQTPSDVWRSLHRVCRINAVQILLELVAETSRDLLWKNDMRREVLQLARDAHIEEWKQAREEKLEKMYDVREVFEARLKDAEEELNDILLHKEVDIIPAKLLEAGLSTEDLKEFKRRQEEKEDEERHRLSRFLEGNGRDVSSELASYIEDGEDDASDFADDEADGGKAKMGKTSDRLNHYDDDIVETQSTTSTNDNEVLLTKDFPQTQIGYDYTHQRIRRSKRIDSRKLEAKNNEQMLLEEDRRLEAVYEEATKIKLSCITTEERICEANVKSLTLQLEKVDELLETLQEEVWADVENIDDNSNNEADLDISIEENRSLRNMNVLDQIIAMVLFSLPNLVGLSNDQFILYKKRKHTSIIEKWKNHFGFLPRAVVRIQGSNFEEGDEINNDVGIGKSEESQVTDTKEVDCVVEDWEELLVEEEDTCLPSRTLSEARKSTKSIGLRPGGSML